MKVIKLGMDTRSVIDRFEAERQALALMDHPNIARVLVTLHDGVPVPKVIDFGIAKATQAPLTDKTLFTAWFDWAFAHLLLIETSTQTW